MEQLEKQMAIWEAANKRQQDICAEIAVRLTEYFDCESIDEVGSAELKSSARKINALPICLGRYGFLALDSTAVIWLHDDRNDTAVVERNPIFIRIAYSKAAAKYDGLSSLIPPCPDTVEVCPLCCRSENSNSISSEEKQISRSEATIVDSDERIQEFFLPSDVVCVRCGGWGWIPEAEERLVSAASVVEVTQQIQIYLGNDACSRYAEQMIQDVTQRFQTRQAEYLAKADAAADPDGYHVVARQFGALPFFYCDAGFLALTAELAILMYDKEAELATADGFEPVFARAAYLKAAQAFPEIAGSLVQPCPSDQQPCSACRGTGSGGAMPEAGSIMARFFAGILCASCGGWGWPMSEPEMQMWEWQLDIEQQKLCH